MITKFALVKEYLYDMALPIIAEEPDEELVIVDDEDNGVKNLVIDCEDPILILEQVLIPVPDDPRDLFKQLLQWNRKLVHGAFALDEDGKLVVFRDTLQLENLDRNELEGSIRALGLALAEFGPDLIGYAA
jgi:hypothetical protein